MNKLQFWYKFWSERITKSQLWYLITMALLLIITIGLMWRAGT